MDIKYVVLPEKKMVKAIGIWNGRYAEGITDDVGDLLVSRGVRPDLLRTPTVTIGISKVHPDDEWDETVGKQVARDKLLVKYNTRLAKVHKLCKDNMERIMENSNWRVTVCERKIRNATERLK